MPEQFRIYEFRTPNNNGGSNFKDTLISILPTLGIFLIAIFIFSAIGNSFQDLLDKIIFLPILIISLVLHELSHAYMADFLGDPTPRLTGRLSLNPMKHLDLWGTLLFIFCGFGWAKPVQVDASNFRKPDKAMASVAMAGPLCNFLLAVIAIFVYKICGYFSDNLNFLKIMRYICIYSSLYNLMLAVFNLLPIPPLDGSRLVHYMLPAQYKAKYYQFSQQYAIILFLLVFMYAGKMIAPIALQLTQSLWDLII